MSGLFDDLRASEDEKRRQRWIEEDRQKEIIDSLSPMIEDVLTELKSSMYQFYSVSTHPAGTWKLVQQVWYDFHGLNRSREERAVEVTLNPANMQLTCIVYGRGSKTCPANEEALVRTLRELQS